ncbi:peptidase domain-containing ABC transporter [bacterium]|nr:peptidase domain-containing ABC transporter [bacterium]
MLFSILYYSKKYPVIRQYEQQDCAPAALLSILKFYKGNSTIVYLRELCHTDRQGTRLVDIVNAANRIGFKAWGAKGSYEELLREKMPCIAHVEYNGYQHYVVIYRITQDKLLLGDPAKGLHWINKMVFLSIWKSKCVILLIPDSNLLNDLETNWWKWFKPYLVSHSIQLEQTLFIGLLCAGLNLIPAKAIQLVIDYFIPKKSIPMIIWTGILLLFVLLIRAIMGFIRTKIFIILNKGISTQINNDFLHHLFLLPKTFFDSRKTGDITSRLDDSLKIQESILLLINSVVIDGLVIIGSLLLMFYFSTKLVLIALPVLPIYSIMVFYMGRKIREKQYTTMRTHANLKSTYIDSIQGYDTLINYNGQHDAILRNQTQFDLFQSALQNFGLFQLRVNLFSESSMALLLVGTVTMGAFLVAKCEIMLGRMIAVYSLFSYLLPSINTLIKSIVSLEGARVAIHRLMDLLLIEREFKNGSNIQTIQNNIEIDALSFSYPKSKILFQNLSLRFESGKLYGLWGSNGSGKSTLINLLLCKYIYCTGKIRFDGKPVEQINRDDIRRCIAVVDQECKIFNGTLGENILCGRSVSSYNEIKVLLKPFRLDAIIEKFPYGIITILGEDGRHLSSGERQLVGLCRALLRKPKVLIIDEGLSSVDIETKEIIFNIIQDYSRKNIVILISHDINLLLRADYLFHIGNDGIDEAGCVFKLLKQDMSQFKQFFEIQTRLIQRNANQYQRVKAF